MAYRPALSRRVSGAGRLQAALFRARQKKVIRGAYTGTFWNTADKGTSIALSADDLTATGSAGSGKVRGVASRASNKLYLEFSNITQVGAAGIIGFGSKSATLNDAVLTNTIGVQPNGAMLPSGNLGNPAGHVLQCAIDLVHKLVWFRLDTGNWNGNPNAHPSTGAGGLPFTASEPLFPLVCLQTGGSVKINAGNSAFKYIVPSGFAPWGA